MRIFTQENTITTLNRQNIQFIFHWFRNDHVVHHYQIKYCISHYFYYLNLWFRIDSLKQNVFVRISWKISNRIAGLIKVWLFWFCWELVGIVCVWCWFVTDNVGCRFVELFPAPELFSPVDFKLPCWQIEICWRPLHLLQIWIALHFEALCFRLIQI